MTCCSGSSVSSAAETVKACFSSSTIVGSATTSASNCSSGTSTRSFLPSGPTACTAACSSSAVAGRAAAFFAGAFFAAGAAAFLAGALVAAALEAGAFSAAFEVFAGAFLGAALAAWGADFRVAVVDELEDTNYLSVRHGGHYSGAARPVPVNSRSAHSGTDIHTTSPRPGESRAADPGRGSRGRHAPDAALAFFSFLNDLTLASEPSSTTSATHR